MAIKYQPLSNLTLRSVYQTLKLIKSSPAQKKRNPSRSVVSAAFITKGTVKRENKSSQLKRARKSLSNLITKKNKLVEFYSPLYLASLVVKEGVNKKD